MKPFNLEEALAGKKVVTRDGRKVISIHYIPSSPYALKVVAVIEGAFNEYRYYYNGCYDTSVTGTSHDLFMAPEKKEVWVNLCFSNEEFYLGFRVSGGVYKTEQEAVRVGKTRPDYVKSVKIHEYEE